jgi:hypothetical protein
MFQSFLKVVNAMPVCGWQRRGVVRADVQVPFDGSAVLKRLLAAAEAVETTGCVGDQLGFAAMSAGFG